MINLFEYRNKVAYNESLDGLESFLDAIWANREKNSFYAQPELDRIESQQFLQFLHATQELKSNKYVGVISCQGQRINLLPKVFFDGDRTYSPNEVSCMHQHILWWLSYCRKIKFPNYHSASGGVKSDFFEVLIYLFSRYTRELLSSAIYQQYQEVDRELSYIKGRLNSSDYVNQNLSRGRWHKLHCTYDAFVIDNTFNRIIKYVTTLLFNATSHQENKKNLREILFILDEVSDERVSAEQCSRVIFNPMFGEFETVRDYCQLFLNNCISFDYKNDLRLFAFLLPMEYLFEDFIFGFIDKELEDVSARAQRSDTYLDESRIFNLKPDLHIRTAHNALIADTKYKIVYSDADDPKKGISQSDLYQMLAYAVRFKCEHIVLFYPNTVHGQHKTVSELKIKDEFADSQEISIDAYQLPIVDRELLHMDMDANMDLLELFEPIKIRLKAELRKVLLHS